MLTIHKFKVRGEPTPLEIPATAKILTVQYQETTRESQVVAWVLLDTEEKRTTRTIVTYATGEPILDADLHRYISTFQIGNLVFHAFEAL